ncbi:WxL domain-containing protein [Listeria kieliensis]
MKKNTSLKVMVTSLVTVLGVSAVTIPAYAADGGETSSRASISFEKKSTGTKPENPNGGGGTITPVDPEPVVPTVGPLSIDYISNIHFGSQKISGQDETYKAELDKVKDDMTGNEITVPHYVQVTDDRGSNAGWKLTVSQGGQFKHSISSKELAKASLSFASPKASSSTTAASKAPTVKTFTLNPNGTAAEVMTASADKGMGTWLDVFGTNADTAISLMVPGDTAKEEGKYQTTLTWTLADTPA